MYVWLGLFLLFYMFMARYFPNRHSLFHCSVATIWNVYFIFIHQSFKIYTPYNYYLRIGILHSMGYFIADTLDIVLFDNKNEKRKIYIFHHLLTVFCMLLSLNFCTFSGNHGLWTSEIGGILHHVKNMYRNRIIFIIYFILYLFTRLTLFYIITYGLFFFENINIFDYVLLISLYPIIFQNLKWLYINTVKEFGVSINQ